MIFFLGNFFISRPFFDFGAQQILGMISIFCWVNSEFPGPFFGIQPKKNKCFSVASRKLKLQQIQVVRVPLLPEMESLQQRKSGQIIATSHDPNTPKGSKSQGKSIPLFQANLGW